MQSSGVKVIGIGLNKTATKSLGNCFKAFGFNNQSFSLDMFHCYQQGRHEEIFEFMESYDSFEDWPWPLMYREIDQRFPTAKFILTTRKDAETWYRSLCKMAVRMGPLEDFEKHIYGYSMPQGHKSELIEFYDSHNSAVREYFSERPGKLLEIAFEKNWESCEMAEFLGKPDPGIEIPHVNKSVSVYDGESLFLAHLNRVIFQLTWHCKRSAKSVREWFRANSQK